MLGVYAGARPVDGAALAVTFDAEEIKAVAFSLDRTSAPSPDGIGPAFYHAAWPSVWEDVARLFDGICSSAACLDAINRAYITLLPKGDGVPSPDDFHPVSL